MKKILNDVKEDLNKQTYLVLEYNTDTNFKNVLQGLSVLPKFIFSLNPQSVTLLGNRIIEDVIS